MLRIEPASYALARGRALAKLWPGELDVLFISRARTQNWCLDNPDAYAFLPTNPLAAIAALHQIIRQTQPDLLHVAGWGAPLSLAAIMSGHARGLPVVVDLDTWRGTPSRWRGAIKQFVYPRIFSRVTHFAPGGSRQAAFLRRFGVPDDKITPIQMTVDVKGIQHYLSSHPTAGDRFRGRFGVAPDVPLALFIGRLESSKGITDLLNAWPHVTSRVPGIQLLFVGEGGERDKLSAAAAKDPSIHAVGRLSGNDVWSAYAAADLVVAPSRFEPWGLVVNEAMAAGTPIIVTDAFGCVGELARDGETALVVPPYAPDRIADAIIGLALQPEKRFRQATAASRHISHWTIENEAERVVGIWRSLLENDNAR